MESFQVVFSFLLKIISVTFICIGVCSYSSFILVWYSIIRTKCTLSIFLLVDIWIGSSYPCILSSFLSSAMLLWPFLFMSLRCALLDSPGCVFLEVEFLEHKVCSASALIDNGNVHFSLHPQWCGQAFPLLNIFINTWHFNIFGWRQKWYLILV